MVVGADEVRDRVEARWRALRDAVERLGVAGLEQPTPAGWTAKEMLAHVAFWDEARVPVITYILRGRAIPDGWRFASGYVSLQRDGDWPRDFVHNAREAAWARGQMPEAVLQRLDASHAAAEEALASVTDAEVAEHEAYFTALPDHYDEHLLEVEALLAAQA